MNTETVTISKARFENLQRIERHCSRLERDIAILTVAAVVAFYALVLCM
jgi:hypothetical protein